MLTIQELKPFMDEYPWKIKAARQSKNITQKQLAEITGVPLSAITKMNINNQDALLNCIAICRVLDLSVDELFGLKSAEDEAERAEKIHTLEIENTRLTGDVRRLTEIGTEKDKRIYSHRPMLYALVGICVILALSLVGYMIFDASISTAGLFKSAGTSVFAIVLMLVILLALVVVFLAVRSDLEWNK